MPTETDLPRSAKAYLASVNPSPWSSLPFFQEFAAQDRFKLHHLCDNPAEADIILLVDVRQGSVDWRLSEVRKHPLVRDFVQKTFIYNEMDFPWCGAQGLYVSLPVGVFDAKRVRAVGYPWIQNQYVMPCAAEVDAAGSPDLLFSFAGRQCAPVRKQILTLKHPRGIIEDTSAYDFFNTADESCDTMDERRRQYGHLVARSKYVLCPRGSGTASFRLFEAMSAGRVPVILSDEWVPPIGPHWSSCSIRIRESAVSSIPRILEEHEDSWITMASAARSAWREWFAPEVVFHRFVEACLELKRIPRLLGERYTRHIPSVGLTRVWLRHAKAKCADLIRRRIEK